MKHTPASTESYGFVPERWQKGMAGPERVMQVI